MATLLYLVRHGETDDNARLVFQGQGGRGLNRRGRAQAAILAERMTTARVDAIYTSDLERAVETAAIVAAACALEPALDPDLREVDVGAWTGKSHAEVQALYPDEWSAWSSGIDVRRGGGETYGELADRIERVLARIAAAHEGGRVLVVSHGGSIKSHVARLLGVSAAGMRALAGVANTGITLLERDPRGRARLLAWNDTAHLERLAAEERTA